MSDSQGPLAEIQVLDLTQARSGPTAVRQLADWGADVIRIEPAGADTALALGAGRLDSDFQNLHRNKRCIKLNLADERGFYWPSLNASARERASGCRRRSWKR